MGEWTDVPTNLQMDNQMGWKCSSTIEHCLICTRLDWVYPQHHQHEGKEQEEGGREKVRQLFILTGQNVCANVDNNSFITFYANVLTQFIFK